MRKIALGEWSKSFLPPRQLFLAMKLTTLLLFLTFMQVYAKGYGQGKISLRLQEISIRQLLKEVEKQTDYRFVYHNEALPENKKLTVNVKDAELDEILSKALEGTALTYAVKADGLVVIYTAPLSEKAAADVIIKGKVTSNDNLPLAGVSVRVSGSTAGTLTDANGVYSLRVPENAGTLEFSLVGYVTKLVAIENRLQVNVNLEYDVKTLSGVVVTGYSSYSRNKSVSAATTVSSDKISQVPMTPDQILQGRVPGLVVAAGSGQPGQNAKVTIRGVGTIEGNTNVLYVMDGIPLEYGYLQTINPDDIESMTVLKDASAKALYGSKGSNGVIVITTKKGKAGKLSFDYKSQYGISNMPTPTFKMLNAAEHLQLEEEIGLETGEPFRPGLGVF